MVSHIRHPSGLYVPSREELLPPIAGGADFPLMDGQRWTGSATAASTHYVTVQSGAANTKGSWVELIASTPFESSMLYTSLGPVGGSHARRLWDIGVGAAGSEQVLIPNLAHVESTGNPRIRFGIGPFPVSIPVGTRVSARVQNNNGSDVSYQASVSVHLLAASFGMQPLNRWFDYGTITASTEVTSVDPGATVNTKGAWTQITPSTSLHHRMFLMAVTGYNNANEMRHHIDIGVGGAGSEVVVVPDLPVYSHTNNAVGTFPLPYVFPLPIEVPAGTRLAVRCQSSSNVATYRLLKIALYGGS